MQSHQAAFSKQSGMFGRNGPLSCRQSFFGSQLNSAVSRAHIRAGPSRRSGGLTVRAEKVGSGTWTDLWPDLPVWTSLYFPEPSFAWASIPATFGPADPCILPGQAVILTVCLFPPSPQLSS